MKMGAAHIIAFAAAATVLHVACAQNGAIVKDGTARIGLGRRASWTSYAVKLPTISGPTAQLRLTDRTLVGFVENSSLRLKIDDDRASGFGPSGSVDVTIRQQGGGGGELALVIDGLWNDGPVHLVLGPMGLQASVTRWGKNLSQQATCSYHLDRSREQEGVLIFTGTSVCQGLPERTRLEIDERVSRMLKPAELGVLLVTILASPPRGPP